MSFVSIQHSKYNLQQNKLNTYTAKFNILSPASTRGNVYVLTDLNSQFKQALNM